MGAAFTKDSTIPVCSSSNSFDDVPENCISIVLMFLEPTEICKLAALNRAFRSASSADFIWNSKLPSNYAVLLRRILPPCSSDRDHRRLPKKEIFARLSRPNLFDCGTKELWLDKSSGKLFVSISSKALKITGIEDRRYWNFVPTDESRFESVAYLKQIWWVEIRGELELEFPKGNYSLYFRLQLGKPSKKFGRRVTEVGQVHGWEIKPVRFEMTASNAQKASSECYLRHSGNWVLHHVGDFCVQNPNLQTHIKFSLIQIDCTHTKGGLCVDSVFICPSEFEGKAAFDSS
ncbi:F-box protein PP2-A13-like [Cucurbita maxima]|uniref:F-box protein PP2-A13-like n=1 Tax=Cucurbita maxima TaxID=3661 RepID=A0A6J1K1Y6_CUCMA|nr:F-box protein PP2-A13-like [Cucurbita maxima]